ncbi:MAG: hypothetical protein GVY26_07450 [Bacteroidetes bacterium]|jgi:hypothetical protein|nr:hypothetical protein [Bacteroidota bacterium]
MESYIVYTILILSGIVVGLLFALSRHQDAYYHNSRYMGNPYNPYRRYHNSGLFTTIFAAILIGALFFAHYSKSEQEAPKNEGRGVSTNYYETSAREQTLNEVALEIEGKREPQEQDVQNEPAYAAMNMFPGGNSGQLSAKPAPKPKPRHPSSIYIQRMALSNYNAALEKAAELTAETGVTHHVGANSELHTGAYKLLIGPFINRSEAEGYLRHIGGEGFVFDNARHGLSIEKPKRFVY